MSTPIEALLPSFLRPEIASEPYIQGSDPRAPPERNLEYPSFPFSDYRAPGDLPQDPSRALESPVSASPLAETTRKGGSGWATC
jgi:hypothetical protein